MTLIAKMVIAGTPTLIGDLLISGNAQGDNTLSLPTIGSIRSVFPEGSVKVPSDLAQKVAIISDDAIIAWAGSRSAASVVIKEFRDLASRGQLSVSSIKSYFSDKLRADIGDLDVSFAGFIRDSSGVCGFSYGNGGIKGNGPSGTFHAFGTGNKQLAELFPGTPSPEWAGSDNGFPTGDAIATSLSFSGWLLGQEIVSQASLQNFYGGGYEIAYFDGRASKLDDVTFVLWQARSDDSHFAADLLNVTKYAYRGDTLLVRGFTINGVTSDNKGLTAREVCIAVPPVYGRSTATEEELAASRRLPLNSKIFVHCFIMRDGDELIGPTHVSSGGESKQFMRFHESHGRINFDIDEVQRELIVGKLLDALHRGG